MMQFCELCELFNNRKQMLLDLREIENYQIFKLFDNSQTRQITEFNTIDKKLGYRKPVLNIRP